MTQARTFVATETSTRSQIITTAVDHLLTTVDLTSVATEISSASLAVNMLAVEAKITTPVEKDAVVENYTVIHPAIIAVDLPYTAILPNFAAEITSYPNRLTSVAVAQARWTLVITCVAIILYAQNLQVLHVVEQSTIILRHASVVATNCC